ncbi:MAG: response regulator transcription factor [Actinomycetota bacterium]|nr:response regulator transcription factor [Actinomycetota bacterium]
MEAEIEPRWQVYIVAPEPGAREALRKLLEASPDLTVVGEGKPEPETAAELLAAGPHVLVADVGDSDQGVKLCRDVMSARPQLKCLVVAAFDDEGLFHALLVGASDYMLESEARAGRVVEGVRQVIRADRPLAAKLRRRLRATQPIVEEVLADLSPQQLRVAELVAQGLTNAEIAEGLHLSVNTVRNYLGQVMHRLRARNRTEVALAMAQLAVNGPERT